MSSVRAIVFLLLISLALPACRDDGKSSGTSGDLLAPSGTIKFSGQVLDTSGAPLADATVMLFDAGGQQVASGLTDDQGQYTVGYAAQGGPAQRFLVQLRREIPGVPVVTGAAWTEEPVTTLEVEVPLIVVPDLVVAQTLLENGVAETLGGDVKLEGLPETATRVFAAQFDPDYERNTFPGDFRNSEGDALNSSGFFWFSAVDAEGTEITDFDTPPTATVELNGLQWPDLMDLRRGTDRIEVPMYSFDEGLGQWVSEQTDDNQPLGYLVDGDGALIPESQSAAIRQRTYSGPVFVRFPVAHFSFWNLDYSWIGDVWDPFVREAQEQGVRGDGDAGDAVTEEGTPYPDINHAPLAIGEGNPIWLGDWVSADVETPPGEDLFDDGVLDCTANSVTVRVNNQNAARQQITAYLNILADFNKDGDFADEGEWIVANQAVTLRSNVGLTQQFGDLPDLTGVWIRVTALAEPVAEFDGTGIFAAGETEDYFDCADKRTYTLEVSAGFGRNREGLRVRSTGFDNEQLDCGVYRDGTCSVLSTLGGQPGQKIQLQAFENDLPVAVEWRQLGASGARCDELPRTGYSGQKVFLTTCTFTLPREKTRPVLPRVTFPQQFPVNVGILDYANPDAGTDSPHRITGEVRLRNGDVLPIDCGAGATQCEYRLFNDEFDSATFTALPAQGVLFAGWKAGSSCRGFVDDRLTPVCEVDRNSLAARSSIGGLASFGSFPLTLNVVGEGTVGVELLNSYRGFQNQFQSLDQCAGSSSGSSCTFDLPIGLRFQLNPDATEGWRFGAYVADTCQETTGIRGREVGCYLENQDATPREFRVEFDQRFPMRALVTGPGKVVSSGVIYDGSKLDCHGDGVTATDCEINRFDGDVIRVTAIPDDDEVIFRGWSGRCAANADLIDNTSCSLRIDGPFDAIATFSRFSLLQLDVQGPGAIATSVPGLGCGTGGSDSCSGDVPAFEVVTFTGVPQPNVEMLRWTGDCAAIPANTACTITPTTGLVNVGGIFKLRPTLQLTVEGQGLVSAVDFTTQQIIDGARRTLALDCVQGSPAVDCVASVYPDRDVEVVIFPDPGWQVVEWTGACAGQSLNSPRLGAICTFAMTENRTAGARFAPLASLNVSKQGPGKVRSSDGGIDCGGACETQLANGESVTLTAYPDSGADFAGWTGACANSGLQPTCVLTSGYANVTVGANFTARADSHTLTVNVSGSTGYVFNDDESLTCSNTTSPCTMTFPAGSVVNLDAYGDRTGSTWAWGGDCVATPDSSICALTLDQDRQVSIVFSPPPESTLRLTLSGAGQISDGGSVLCTSAQSPCTLTLATGSVLNLSGTPDAAGADLLWGGACQGTPANAVCPLTVDRDLDVNAEFVSQAYTLQLSVTGEGTVSSADGFVVCTDTSTPTDCRHDYAPGASVTLTASPTGTSAPFAGWSGACAAYATNDVCTLTMNANLTVGALFQGQQRSVVVAITGSGTISDAASGQVCASADAPCTFSYTGDQNPQLSASANTNPVVWGGDCAGAPSASDCFLFVNADKQVSADFTRAAAVVSVTVAGDGLVFSEDGKLNCRAASGDCTATYASAESVSLNASEIGAQRFASWSGACAAESTAFCTLTVTGSVNVGAQFVTPSGASGGRR